MTAKIVRCAAAVAAVLGIVPCSGGLARADSAEAVVRQVQARFDATTDFTATVRQQLVMASAGKTINASGTVTFKRPGRMRWALKDGVDQVIVADGQTLWFYQPDEQQVLKAPFQAAFRSTTPISFLTGVGRIADDFDVTVDGTADGRIALSLRPRKGEGELGQLQLSVDVKTFDIVGAQITDPVGNVTKLEFSDLRRNTGVGDALFHFEVPAGVDVIEAPIGN